MALHISPQVNVSQIKVKKRAKIRNRYNQAPHLTQNHQFIPTSQRDDNEMTQSSTPQHRTKDLPHIEGNKI